MVVIGKPPVVSAKATRPSLAGLFECWSFGPASLGQSRKWLIVQNHTRFLRRHHLVSFVHSRGGALWAKAKVA